MIPKIIHYCWFGKGDLPELAKKCIASWQKYLPDYKIIEWNENNFDINNWKYTKEAYELKKFAFVTDVCRLYALKEVGGIYMDTDVEVLSSLDPFLNNTAFSGFEDIDTVPTGIMASEKNGKWVSDLLSYYDDKSFLKNETTLDMTTNVKTITDFMITKGFKMNNQLQEHSGYVTMYPKDFFCPKSYETLEINITENTVCIHHFAGSWLTKEQKIKNKIKHTLNKYLGPKFTSKLTKLSKKA